MSRRPTSLVVVVAVVVAIAATMFYAAAPSTAQQSAAPADHAKSLSRAFRAAAERTMPTVVTIKTRSKPRVMSRGRSNGENPFEGTPLEDFFRDRLDGFNVPMPQVPRSGVGSGTIIDRDGLILTNNHVVEGADEVLVQLADGREFEATDVRTDPATDLAIVRIENAGSLPEAELGDSDDLEIGDWVIAIGNPFELEQTVSAGIISGKGRRLGSIQRAQFLQTDAAINPGNSGGPLVNLDGEIVGVNTAIATNNGGYQGIGFAIPVNLAKWVSRQLVDSGEVRRAYLGIRIGEVSGDVARQLDVSRFDGVLVSDVLPGTPAAEAGIEVGDLITHFEGRRVRTPRDLQQAVERSEFGSAHDVTVSREGRALDLSVVVKAMPADLDSAASSPNLGGGELDDETFSADNLGFAVADIPEGGAEQLGFEGFEGVVVVSVENGSGAQAAGLREGMLIRRVGRQPVASVEEFERAIEAIDPEEGALLLVRDRNGNQVFIVVKAE